MKSRGTAATGLCSLVFAANFGILLVMTVTGVWTQKGQDRAGLVVGVVGCGILALLLFGLSRLEDDEESLTSREESARKRDQIARATLERELLAEIERRRRALR